MAPSIPASEIVNVLPGLIGANGIASSGGGGTPTPTPTPTPSSGPGDGLASGYATVAAFSTAIARSMGAASGIGTVLAAAASAARGAGLATGTSIVTGVSPVSAVPAAAYLYERLNASSLPVQTDNTDVLSMTGLVAGLVGTGTAGATAGKYRTNVSANGKPAVQFSTSQRIDFGRPAGLLSALTATSCALVYIARTYSSPSSSNYGSPCGINAGQGGTGIFVPNMNTSGAGVDNTRSPAGRYIGFNVGLQVLIIQKDPNQSRVYLNATCVGPQSNGMAAGTGTGNWCLGSVNTNGNTGSAHFFHECLVYTGINLGQALVNEITKWAFDQYGEAYPWAGYSDFWVGSGDSIQAGTGGQRGYSSMDWAAFNASRPLGTWSNVSTPGTKMDVMATNAPREFAGMSAKTGLTTKVVLWEWANRTNSNTSTLRSEDLSCITAMKTADPTMKIAIGNSTSIQGGTGDTAQPTWRPAYNAQIVTNASTYTAAGVDAFIDIAANTNIGVLNANPGSGYPTTYFNDTLHLFGDTSAGPNGMTVLAGIIGPAFAAL